MPHFWLGGNPRLASASASTQVSCDFKNSHAYHFWRFFMLNYGSVYTVSNDQWTKELIAIFQLDVATVSPFIEQEMRRHVHAVEDQFSKQIEIVYWTEEMSCISTMNYSFFSLVWSLGNKMLVLDTIIYVINYWNSY